MWQISDGDLALSKDKVHVWRANLNLSADEIDSFAAILSKDERLRADRFRFPQHRRRFIAARGILRKILASYLNLPSKSLQFAYGDRGKPKLLDCTLQFNISHSQELALYGVTCERKIGIDLEYLKTTTDFKKIARRFFAPRETEYIECLSEKKQKQAFFQLWTAKEAYLKATGEGLTGSLDKIEIFITPELSAKLLAIEGNTFAATKWSIISFIPATNYVATLAIDTPIPKPEIKFLNWN